MRIYRVVCTGQGTHGRIGIVEIVANGDLLNPRPTKQHRGRGDADVVAKWSDDPENGGTSRMRRAPKVLRQHGGKERWEFSCGKCGKNYRLNGDNLRSLLELSTTGLLDVSQIPR